MLPFEPEIHVIYDEEHWNLLKMKREVALRFMSRLFSFGVKSYVYGSVARGDVRKASDIDIIVLEPVLPLSSVESILAELGDPVRREIVQATPRSTPKFYIHYEGMVTVSFPLCHLGEKESFFYRFGGMNDLKDVRKRVPGVDKKLMLVYPVEEGHISIGVVGREALAAKILSIPIKVVEERVKVLRRRKEVGTTGLYLKYQLNTEEGLEEAILRLSRVKKWFFRRMRSSGLI
ncbi:MAG: nucleotidyltransferase domain-containing protein [Candidatus Methanodesulfokora washburnensis]|jgi:predicted nucleotidyltransferase|uniref:DNA polymerase subunit beta n=1 Tax=Candidatus Methanodesulfokora washburnensis TaxID=2478471 RepID=A0A3R9QGS5_9CREN|nr:nucleotidyltransferase domain-containing protein [Candidatus Methanodesulfokores washburnensis]RSN76145.1 DNA polymerase subunit beta [Candidatus Methanodesulfokores washburnensis]